MFKPEKNKSVHKNKSNSHNSGVVRNKYGTGVRSYLVNAGFNNSDIGYDGDNFRVTYKGKPVIMPNIVVDGTSYADEDSLRTLALDLHKQEGTDLVSATDYAAKETGIKNAASIDNGYVSMGDKVIKASVSSDGTAYVPRDEIEEATASYKNDIGYQSEKDIYNTWESKYASKIEAALDSIINDEWSYNPEEDPAYRAYVDLYRREGQRAFSEAFGNGIANTNGYTNSAALTAATQGLNHYMQQLADRVPELMQNDYERYYKNNQKRFDAVKELTQFSDGVYDKMYSSNSDYLDRLNDVGEFNYERKLNSDEREINDRQIESEIFNNYVESEKDLIDLEYLPRQYESELSTDAISRALDELELLYLPREYEMELSYKPRLYESELEEYEKNNGLKDLEAKYFLWK